MIIKSRNSIVLDDKTSIRQELYRSFVGTAENVKIQSPRKSFKTETKRKKEVRVISVPKRIVPTKYTLHPVYGLVITTNDCNNESETAPKY
jgi:hypothetical protein